MTIRDWENFAGSDEFIFLLRHSDDKVRNWYKQSKCIDTYCFVSTVHVACCGGAMVWGNIFMVYIKTHGINKRSFKYCGVRRFCG